LPKVSFVIPLFNCLDLTKACLASLQSTLPRGLDHEILLVDDGSTDGTREWLQGLSSPAVSPSNPSNGLHTPAPPVRVLLNDTNLGYAASNNRGAREATGDILGLLNNDLVLLPGWLEPMLAALEGDPSIGVVGNIQMRVDTGEVDHAGLHVTSQGKIAHDRTLPEPGHLLEVPCSTTACALLRRRLFIDEGGFDEAFVNGGEDVDLCFRLRARGYRTVVATGSIVRHHVSATRGPTGERDERNSRLLVHRWRKELVRWGALTWARDHVAACPPSLWSRAGRRSLVLQSFLRTRRVPPKFARLQMESALHREEVRWRQLYDLPHGTPRAPHAPGQYKERRLLRDQFECAWLRDCARIELPAGFPAANIFIAGFLAPPDPLHPKLDKPIGLRVAVNHEQTAILPIVLLGNFNLGIDAPFTLPDRPTVVDIELLGVGWTNFLARVSQLLVDVPIPASWRRRLKPYGRYLFNRRLRFALLVCDDEVIFDFRREPALVERLR